MHEDEGDAKPDGETDGYGHELQRRVEARQVGLARRRAVRLRGHEREQAAVRQSGG